MARKEKHLFFYKDWFVFPVAIGWESDLAMYVQKASRLTIHFLWWHLRWTFIKENK
jgi:hypothetical protein